MTAPQFDLNETGHQVAPALCPDCGPVEARLSYAVVRREDKTRVPPVWYVRSNAIECPECFKLIAFESERGWEAA